MAEKTISMKSLTKAFDIPWWFLLIDGIALFIPGILLFITPAMSSQILVLLLAIDWLIAGILFSMPTSPAWCSCGFRSLPIRRKQGTGFLASGKILFR